jgi:energy-coupling factor transporter ATP-binding protein EcfA2
LNPRSPRSRTTTKDSPGPAYRIRSFSVERLFGLYDYEVDVDRAGSRPGPSLLVLYGDNGSGKTTILQLIFHLLAREDNLGHRSFLARTPFRRLAVTLDPQLTIEAVRPNSALTGEYRLRIARHGQQLAEATAQVDQALAVKSDHGTADNRRNWQTFLQVLSELHLDFFYLRDDRRPDRPPAVDPRADLDFDDEVTLDEHRNVFRYRVHQEESGGRLQATLTALASWIRDEALRRTNIGEVGTRDIYAEIARRIAESDRPGHAADQPTESLIDSLRRLEKRSVPYVDLGLISAPQLTDIVTTLKASPANTRELIGRVVSPYVDSLEKRLDAQKDLMQLVSLFLERINRFLRDKSLSYELARGFSIETREHQSLLPTQLSSGEQQLLALLAQVITARSTATVFLIDEPEISLNVKWQRVLVDTLLQLVRGADVQFILATHSLELLASHREHVFRLGRPD